MLHRMNQANADKRKARKASITVIRSPGASTVFVVSIFSNFRFDFYSFSSGNKITGHHSNRRNTNYGFVDIFYCRTALGSE